MKKLLIILLALAMIFAFAACGQQEAPAEEPVAEEGITAIPLGGGLADLELEGAAFGSYTRIDPLPEIAEGMAEGDELTCYYCEDCDTPYICVLRFPANGKTLEEVADESLEGTGAVAWQNSLTEPGAVAWQNSLTEPGALFQCGMTLSDGKYYYIDCWLRQDGDDFVEVDFFRSTEEVALGESGQYLWLPSGATDLMNEEEIAYGTDFYGEYDMSYIMPMIWVGPAIESYEDFCWLCSGSVEGGEPVADEATFNAWVASGWDDAAVAAYYEALGMTDTRYFEGEKNGCEIVDVYGKFLEGRFDDIYITDGEEEYNIFLFSKLNPYPLYGKVLLGSLHSK